MDRMPSSDPLDPKLDTWLRSVEPRQELVVRYAMRSRFAEVRGDRAFSARIEEVRSALNPDETQLAMILADAREVAKHVGELIGEAPAETKTRERIKDARPIKRG
jgi:hypothetical protein